MVAQEQSRLLPKQLCPVSGGGERKGQKREADVCRLEDGSPRVEKEARRFFSKGAELQ